MKTLFYFIVAAFAFTNSSTAQTACATDCFLNECRITCAAGSTASCTCFLGTFSRCSCTPNVFVIEPLTPIRATRAATLKNALKTGYSKIFANTITALIDTVLKNDSAAYSRQLVAAEALVAKYPKDVQKFEELVRNLKK